MDIENEYRSSSSSDHHHHSGGSKEAASAAAALHEHIVHAAVQRHMHAHFQSASTDHAIMQGLMRVITEKRKYEVISQRTRRKMVFTIGDPYVVKPFVEEDSGSIKAITAQECRYRCKTYACTIYVPWCQQEYAWISSSSSDGSNNNSGSWVQQQAAVYHTTSFQVPVSLGSLMCHSSDAQCDAFSAECPYDIGSYFVVKGTEKVIVCPIIMQNNIPYIRCADREAGHWTLQFRSLSDHKKRSTSTLVIHLHVRKGEAVPTLKVSVPFITVPIPITMVMRLLGVPPCTKTMMNNIMGEQQQQQGGCLLSDTCVRILSLCLTDQYTTMEMTQLTMKLVKYSNSSSHAAAEAADASDDDEAAATGSSSAAAASNVPTAARARTMYNNFTSEFLPHMGDPGTPEYIPRKERMFSYLVWLLMRAWDCGSSVGTSASAAGAALNDRTLDRDDCRYKRIEHTGGEITYLFRRAWRPYIKTVLGAAHNSMENHKKISLPELTKLASLQTILLYAFATGNWGTEKAGSSATGISQQRATLNHGAAISHVDRVASQLKREGKDPRPRLLHTSQWGVFCPVETPEGEACGQSHNLTIATHIRIGCPSDLIRPFVLLSPRMRLLTECTRTEIRTRTRVMLNGALEGIYEDDDDRMSSSSSSSSAAATVASYVDFLRKRRHRGALPHDASIAWDPVEKMVTVCTDPGASMRPVLVVEKLPLLSSVVACCRRYPHLLNNTLLSRGVMQYMDKEEEHMALVASSLSDLMSSTKKSSSPDAAAPGNTTATAAAAYTHVEVHPALILGYCASLIPFSDKNQAPRNIYGSCMTKQAGGRSSTCSAQHNDTVALSLWYPQRPLAFTAPAVASHANDLPTGQNPIVAILPLNGNNQEDAIEIAKSSLDMGMFRTHYDRTYRDEEGGSGVSRTQFTYIPARQSHYDARGNPVSNSRDMTYTALGGDGVVDPGEFVSKGTCIVGKREVNPSDYSTKDLSSMYRGREDAQVVSVRYVTSDSSACKQVLVKLAAHRRPQIGDKFSSRHGQKGVCGDEVQRCDLPFTTSGLTPDLIVNPHGQPSRMTVGQMIEGVVSKLACLLPTSHTSTQIDATPFRNCMLGRDGYEHIDALDDALGSLGYMSLGHEMMYSGVTGLPLSSVRLYRLPTPPSQTSSSSSSGGVLEDPQGGGGVVVPERGLAAAAKSSAEEVILTGDNGTCISPLYYQALRHIAKEKLGARQKGPYDPVTLQPIDGRSRNGGLRFGEMEKDAISCYGAAEILRGRLFKDSDAFPIIYCTRCHREGHSTSSGALYCRACGPTKGRCIQTYVPKGMHCAIHESQAMLVGWRMKCAPESANPFPSS